MKIPYYSIFPDLTDENVSYIDDWEFTYWPNKPEGKIIQNPNGTFSIEMEKDFIPLVTQLQNLFKDSERPENGTYLGEAVLKGKNEPLDCIYGNYIDKYQGLVISKKFLAILEKFELSKYYIYPLPLIKRKKTYKDYYFIYFENIELNNCEMQLIKIENSVKICVKDTLKLAIEEAGMKGCIFTLVNL
jgi:hypothetical protein